MRSADSAPCIDWEALDEAALVALARAGKPPAFAQIMRRCNQRLFRVARGVVHEDAEAEDVVQAAYVEAFEHFHSFRGDAAVLTWLTRIVLNEAHMRLRARKPVVGLEAIELAQQEGGRVLSFPNRAGIEDPASAASRREIRALLERAIDELPEAFRLVFVMREIEECSIEETAASLGLRAETVKTRLHRARRQLRASLYDTLSTSLGDAFPFLGARCERITQHVLARIESDGHFLSD